MLSKERKQELLSGIQEVLDETAVSARRWLNEEEFGFLSQTLLNVRNELEGRKRIVQSDMNLIETELGEAEFQAELEHNRSLALEPEAVAEFPAVSENGISAAALAEADEYWMSKFTDNDDPEIDESAYGLSAYGRLIDEYKEAYKNVCKEVDDNFKKLLGSPEYAADIKTKALHELLSRFVYLAESCGTDVDDATDDFWSVVAAG